MQKKLGKVIAHGNSLPKLKFEFEGEVRELIPVENSNSDEGISIFHERKHDYVTEEFFVMSVLRDLTGKKVRITIQEV